jgi:hypothetical protein
MEVCLIGLFFLVRNTDDEVACKGQAICMIVVLILTAGYQILLNEAFSPLIRYLPITLEMKLFGAMMSSAVLSTLASVSLLTMTMTRMVILNTPSLNVNKKSATTERR